MAAGGVAEEQLREAVSKCMRLSHHALAEEVPPAKLLLPTKRQAVDSLWPETIKAAIRPLFVSSSR